MNALASEPIAGYSPGSMGVFITFNGDAEGDGLGRAVSDAGDVNGDGFADLVVGVRNDDNNGTFPGSARVNISELIQRLCADQNEDGLVTPVDFTAWIAAFNQGRLSRCNQLGAGL